MPLAQGEMWVSNESDSAPVRIRFRLIDGNELEVRGLAAASRAVFRPRVNGIAVTNIGGGELQVDVPRAATRFVLRVRGVTHVVKDGPRLRVLAESDTAGADIVFVTR